MIGNGGTGVGGTGVGGSGEGMGEGEGLASVGWSGGGVVEGVGETVGVIVGTTGIVALPCTTASVARKANSVASGTSTPHAPKSARFIGSGLVLCSACASL